MFNPFDPYQNSGSYVDLLKRMTQRVQQTKVDDQILEIVQRACEKEMDQLNVVLSRPERKRLFNQVMKAVLTDILAKIESTE